ncbi:MAG TPA: Flp family type IVb pilin [Polyangia bacterium]
MLQNLFTNIKKLAKDEEGPTAVEYGLMVGLIAAVIILTVKALGTKVNTEFSYVDSQMPTP